MRQRNTTHREIRVFPFFHILENWVIFLVRFDSLLIGELANVDSLHSGSLFCSFIN